LEVKRYKPERRAHQTKQYMQYGLKSQGNNLGMKKAGSVPHFVNFSPGKSQSPDGLNTKNSNFRRKYTSGAVSR
jgi:hypothetical protein